MRARSTSRSAALLRRGEATARMAAPASSGEVVATVTSSRGRLGVGRLVGGRRQRAQQAAAVGDVGARVAVLVVAGGPGQLPRPGHDPVDPAPRSRRRPSPAAARAHPGRDPAARSGAASTSRQAIAKVVWRGPLRATGRRAPARRSWRCLFSAAQVNRNSSRASGCSAGDPLGQLLHVGRRDGAGGDHRPRALLVDRQLGRVHQAPLVGDHSDPALRVRPRRGRSRRPSFTIGFGGRRRQRRRRGGGGVTSPLGR